MTEHLDRDTRREQILNAALKLFVAKGFDNCTVDEVAKEAGLSKGSVYWYFKSKLEILFELVDRCVLMSQEAVVRSAEADKYGPEAFWRVHRDLHQTHLLDQQHRDRDQLMSQLVSLSSRHPEISERLRSYYLKWDAVTQSLIQRGMDDGHFRKENALLIGQAISAMYDGLFMREQVDPGVDIIGVIETATRLMYESLTQVREHPYLAEAAGQ